MSFLLFKSDVIRSKNIIITGASSGIGSALAVLLAEHGNNLFLFGRDNVKLAQVAELCDIHSLDAKASYECEAHSIDVCDSDAMHERISEINDKNPIDIVIANAGISCGSAVHLKNLVTIRDVIDTNLLGVVNTVSSLVNRWLTHNLSGHVVIVCSMAGLLALPSCLEYSTSKNALRCYAESLCGLLKGSNIKVSIVYPGFVRTPMTAVNKFPMPLQMDPEKAAKIIVRGISLGKRVIAFPYFLYLLLKLVAMLPLGWRLRILSRLPHKG